MTPTEANLESAKCALEKLKEIIKCIDATFSILDANSSCYEITAAARKIIDVGLRPFPEVKP